MKRVWAKTLGGDTRVSCEVAHGLLQIAPTWGTRGSIRPFVTTLTDSNANHIACELARYSYPSIQ